MIERFENVYASTTKVYHQDRILFVFHNIFVCLHTILVTLLKAIYFETNAQEGILLCKAKWQYLLIC